MTIFIYRKSQFGFTTLNCAVRKQRLAATPIS